MGSRKKLARRLRNRELVLPVAKGSMPLSADAINDFFDRSRKLRDAEEVEMNRRVKAASGKGE